MFTVEVTLPAAYKSPSNASNPRQGITWACSTWIRHRGGLGSAGGGVPGLPRQFWTPHAPHSHCAPARSCAAHSERSWNAKNAVADTQNHARIMIGRRLRGSAGGTILQKGVYSEETPSGPSLRDSVKTFGNRMVLRPVRLQCTLKYC